MYPDLFNVADALFLLCAPALLLAHAIWPRRISWVVVLIGAATLGWAFVLLSDYLFDRSLSQCISRSGTWGDTVWAESCPLVDGREGYHLQLGWLKGLIYLGLWLPLYVALLFIRARVRNGRWTLPNTSLERTREG